MFFLQGAVPGRLNNVVHDARDCGLWTGVTVDRLRDLQARDSRTDAAPISRP